MADIKLNQRDEKKFQEWYSGHAERLGLKKNPDDPEHHYKYREAWKAGSEPGRDRHWPSKHKEADHPNAIVGGVNTITGDYVYEE